MSTTLELARWPVAHHALHTPSAHTSPAPLLTLRAEDVNQEPDDCPASAVLNDEPHFTLRNPEVSLELQVQHRKLNGRRHQNRPS